MLERLLAAISAEACLQAASGVSDPDGLLEPVKDLVGLQAAGASLRAADYLSKDCLDNAKFQLHDIHIDSFAKMRKVGRPQDLEVVELSNSL